MSLRDLEKNNFDIVQYKVLRDITYLVQDSVNSKYILKLSKCPENIFQRLIEYILKTNLKFKIELEWYKSFADASFRFFGVPKLIYTDSTNFMLLEYLEEADAGFHNISNYQQYTAALAEFQTSRIETKLSLLERIITRSLYSPTSIILRKLKTLSKQHFSLCLKIIAVIVMCNLKQEKFLNKIVVHNDVIDNVLTKATGNLYFIDFAYTVVTPKWLLIDIIEPALDLNTFSIDKQLLTFYLHSLNKENLISEHIDYYAQFRMALLYRTVNSVHSGSTEVKSKCISFIKNQLLNDTNYKKWYSRNAEPIVQNALS